MATSSLPDIFEPLLSYLAQVLPPPIYSVVATLLAQSVALISSLVALGAALVSSSPSSWNAQTILPPLITLLAAYLALVSFYRTAGWMIRTAFAFVKWGTIFVALGAAAGYVLANANNGDNAVVGLFGVGLVPLIGGFILDMINGDGQNAAGGSRNAPNSRTRTQTRSRTQANSQARPKAWESWDRHTEWQYNEKPREGDGSSPDVQKVVGQILGAAGKTVRESRWWETAKGVVDELTHGLQGGVEGEGSEGGRKQPERKAKSQKNSNQGTGSR